MLLTHHYSLDIAQDWFDAWNSRDLSKILSLYTDNVSYSSPFATKIMGDGEGKIRGKAALWHYFSKLLDVYPNLHLEPIQILSGVDSIVIYYRSVTGLITAELMVLDQQGLIAKAIAHHSAVGLELTGVRI